MQMRHEITHMRIVHCCLRLGFPGLDGRGVVGKKADDIDLGQIAKFGAAQILEFATEYKVEELFAVRGHELPIQGCGGPVAVSRQSFCMFDKTMKKLPVICFKHFLCASPLPAAREFAPCFGCR